MVHGMELWMVEKGVHTSGDHNDSEPSEAECIANECPDNRLPIELQVIVSSKTIECLVITMMRTPMGVLTLCLRMADLSACPPFRLRKKLLVHMSPKSPSHISLKLSEVISKKV